MIRQYDAAFAGYGTMEQSRVKIAVVGAGLIGPRHIKSIVACHDTELICIVDPSEAARLSATAYEVPLYASVQCMLRQVVPEAAIVCTPNATHVSISKELLHAGTHVLVEKPLSTTVDDGRDLVSVASKSGKHLLVGHHRRFNPYTVAAKRLLASGTIGTVVAISGLWCTYKPQSYFDPPTAWRARSGSGGPIMINLIHEIDILQYLLGPITRVNAEQTKSQRGHEAEEGAAILLRFGSGVVGTFLLSDATPSSHTFEQATGENPMLPKSGRDIYRIFGTEGSFSVGDMKITKHREGDEKSWTSRLEETVVPVGDEVPFDEQINHLVRVVRSEEQPVCSGTDGLRAVVVCDAIKRALITSMPVDVWPSKL